MPPSAERLPDGREVEVGLDRMAVARPVERNAQNQLSSKIFGKDLADGAQDRFAEGVRSFEDALLAKPRLVLHLASNPFDHLDLLEEGVRAYEQTSDARVDGRLLDIRKILRDGFRSGRLDLLLIAQNQHERLAEEKGEALGGMDEDAVGTEEQCRRVEAGTGMSGGGSAAFAGHELLLSPPTIPQIVGFDVVSVHRNWLQGHQVYLKPTHRGKGLLAAYFDAALALASSRGLDGMFFWSTLDRWLQKPPKGFKMKGQLKQSNGVMVRSFWREV